MDWKNILQVQSSDPEDARRRNLLNILLAGVLVAAIVGILIVGYGLVARMWSVQDASFVPLIFLLFIIGVLIMLVAWAFYTGVLLSERKIFARIFADPERIDMDRALKIINAYLVEGVETEGATHLGDGCVKGRIVLGRKINPFARLQRSIITRTE